MTVQELSQLYYLNREIERNERKLEELEQSIGPGAAPLTGMPHGAGLSRGQTERLAAELADLYAIIAAKRMQCVHERTRLERYISEIPDSLTRAIFEHRFCDCLTWDQVAARVGGGNTPWGVKKRCYRYLKATEPDEDTAAAERQTAAGA